MRHIYMNGYVVLPPTPPETSSTAPLHYETTRPCRQAEVVLSKVGSSKRLFFGHRLVYNISKRRDALPRLPVAVQRRRVLVLVPHPRALVSVLAFVKVVPWGLVNELSGCRQ